MKRKAIDNLPAYTAASIIHDYSGPQRAAFAERKRRHAAALASHNAACASHRQPSTIA